MIRTAAAALLLASALASAAHAETVYLRSGQREGQGWIFAHATGCWVATAGHVVPEDRAGVIVIGAGGARGQGERIVRDPAHDLALIRIAGTLASACPASPLGDRDVRPMLDRVRHEGAPVAFERRAAQPGTTNVSYGVEDVPLQLLGISETAPTFTLRPERARGDEVYATDSGGPIRFRGSGIGEAGLPLGIVIQTERERSGAVDVVALRMDAVRAFFESAAAGTAREPERAAPFGIARFEGETRDTACGPLNLLAAAQPCGWRASRSAQPIELVLDLGPAAQTIGGAALRFAAGAVPKGVVVATSFELGGGTQWLGERYCALRPAAREVTCALGLRTVRGIRIVMDGRTVELLEVRVLGR
ncbi:MAG: hypothetical protein QOI11_3739 [Candidatus Eremiobacteraeota bacterium]|nr:hypothetical protein [Candidatus Eremiobacteraeota bacterium]